MVKSVEVTTMVSLAPLTGMKLPCRWSHKKGNKRSCYGGSMLGDAARRKGLAMRTFCQDGTLYIFRYK